jgi:hypothetical protein
VNTIVGVLSEALPVQTAGAYLFSDAPVVPVKFTNPITTNKNAKFQNRIGITTAK